MHSSSLRGTNFGVTRNGQPVTHHDFLASFSLNDRLGLVVHHPLDGLGAAALVLAYVTRFYDCLRAEQDEFIAYPDFFSFQSSEQITSYGMLDIWPEYKDVAMPHGTWPRIAAIASRGISILVVPDVDACLPGPADRRDQVTLESLRRSVTRCYAYAPPGSSLEPDLTIRCTETSSMDWGLAIIERSTVSEDGEDHRQRWNQSFANGELIQSYREIDLDTALAAVAAAPSTR